MRIERDINRGPSSMRAEIREGGVELLDELAPAWRELCAEGPADEPFYRPEWMRAHVEAFAPGARMLVVTAWRGGALRAVLPLLPGRGTFAGIPVRLLRAPAGDHACRFDVVRGAGDADEAIRALWGALRDRGGFDVIELRDVPEGGGGHALAQAAEDSGSPTGKQLSLRTPYVPLPGSIDELLARTDGRFRSNLRRRRRKLDGRGEVRLQRVTDASALERFFALERAGWKGEEGTAIACDPATRRYYEILAREGARHGYLCMFLLTCGGEDVAIHFGLEWKGRYFLPKPAYHEAYRECSPGQLVVLEVLQDAITRSLREFDFLGPMMEWKADWAPQVREHFHVWLLRGGPVGRALHAARFKVEATLRQTGKQLLGGKGS